MVSMMAVASVSNPTASPCSVWEPAGAPGRGQGQGWGRGREVGVCVCGCVGGGKLFPSPAATRGRQSHGRQLAASTSPFSCYDTFIIKQYAHPWS